MQLKSIIVAAAAIAVLAGTAQVSLGQTLKVTKFDTTKPAGGVTIQAEWDQGSSPWCKDEDVRWIQRILLKKGDGTTPKDDVPGYPKASFIDPQPTQGGKNFDNLPWYDFTYNSAADRDSNTNVKNGSGKFFNDSPGGWGPFGPMYFCGWTAVVCYDSATKKGAFMGGFTWGFCVSATGAITGIAPAALDNSDATVGIFNTALGAGADAFRAYGITKGDDKCQLKFSSVPEPSSMVVLVLAAGALAARRRNR